jgi:hypothetical protein
MHLERKMFFSAEHSEESTAFHGWMYKSLADNGFYLTLKGMKEMQDPWGRSFWQ